MSSEGRKTGMEEGGKLALVPRLRFPEFRCTSGWEPVTLHKASVPVTERVGERKLTPVSISAGIGFVPQAEKFGRDISGNQYQLYTLVNDGDFVYNKGNSLKFPQGCVYQLQGWGQVAAPNVFICFRLKDGYSDRFFQNCFEQNLHGKHLKRHITSGARSNGLLNISKENFFGVEVPTPTFAEQQKIAECLTSLDELIAAQARKVDALKKHKKGLMQDLFPRKGETQPRLRFPEFKDAGKWERTELGPRTIKVGSGITPTGGYRNYKRAGRPFIRSQNIGWAALLLEDVAYIDEETHASFNSSEIKNCDVLLNITGASIGRSAVADERIVAGNVNQHVCIIRTKPDELNPFFLNQYIISKRGQDQIDSFQAGGNRQGLNFAQVKSLAIPLPPTIDEQQRIASCLTRLDTLTVAEIRKLEALKRHKRSLMQQLFPSPTEAER
jgi:type I restriction enzyme S subunit